MICVACEVLAARSVDHPPTVDLVEIAVAARLELFSLRGRELAAFVFDDKGTRLDRRCSKEPKPGRERPTRKACLRGISGIYNDSYWRQDALFPIRAPGDSLKAIHFQRNSPSVGRTCHRPEYHSHLGGLAVPIGAPTTPLRLRDTGTAGAQIAFPVGGGESADAQGLG